MNRQRDLLVEALLDSGAGEETGEGTAADAPAGEPQVFDHHVRVFDIDQLNKALVECVSDGTFPESKRKLNTLLRRVRTLGADRPRSKLNVDWRAKLAQLEADFPNFLAVIQEAICPHLAALAAGARGSRMSPILLIGPPGIGKSFFARRLGELLGAPVSIFDMASCQTSADLAGTSAFWENSSPGIVLRALGWGLVGQGAVCDPVIVLDEVDKCTADRYDPIGPLHALLGRSSAARFEDQCALGLTVNASLIRWILTANDPLSVAAPVRSRTLQFSYPASYRFPNARDCARADAPHRQRARPPFRF